MKALGINGSGRSEGNTAMLVGAVLEGAAAGGAETDILNLATMNLYGCIGCQICNRVGFCAVNDDMQRFYDRAADTDVLVLGTPIYLDHVTAQMKAFLDRLYCYIGPDMENSYPNKAAKAVVCITYGASGEHAYDSVLDWLKGRLHGYWGIECVGGLTVAGCSSREPMDGDHPAVSRARELGRSLI